MMRGIPPPDYALSSEEIRRFREERARAYARAEEQGIHWSHVPELCAVDWPGIDRHLSSALLERTGFTDETVYELEDDREIIVWLQRRLYHIAVTSHDMEPRAFRKSFIPAALRKTVMERDAYRCRMCSGWVDLSVDHIVPESLGGPTSLENLQTLCRSCNSRKGNR